MIFLFYYLERTVDFLLCFYLLKSLRLIFVSVFIKMKIVNFDLLFAYWAIFLFNQPVFNTITMMEMVAF